MTTFTIKLAEFYHLTAGYFSSQTSIVGELLENVVSVPVALFLCAQINNATVVIIIIIKEKCGVTSLRKNNNCRARM